MILGVTRRVFAFLCALILALFGYIVLTAVYWPPLVAYFSVIPATLVAIGAAMQFAKWDAGAQKRRTERWEREHPDPALEALGRYRLADDIAVPLIEVVLRAEADALCEHRGTPKMPEHARYSHTNHGWEIPPDTMTYSGWKRHHECACPPWPGKVNYAEKNGPLRCGTCHGFIPHERYVLPKAVRNCKHEATIDSLCVDCGQRICQHRRIATYPHNRRWTYCYDCKKFLEKR